LHLVGDLFEVWRLYLAPSSGSKGRGRTCYGRPVRRSFFSLNLSVDRNVSSEDGDRFSLCPV